MSTSKPHRTWSAVGGAVSHLSARLVAPVAAGSRHLGGKARQLSGRQRAALGGAAVVVVAGAALTMALSGGAGSRRPPASAPGTTAAPVVRPSTTTTPKPARTRARRVVCPLTGMPAPHGRVPDRPALGVKIGNDPASRPQSGLPHADVVYDALSEGGITRYLAIFQCHEAAKVGPVRSVRWNDWHLLGSYGHPILAFAGGISYWERAVAQRRWIFDASAFVWPASNAFYRTSSRVPPWNLYTSTSRLWAVDKNHTPPRPQFVFSRAVPRPSFRASEVTIANFDVGYDGTIPVTWKWDAHAGAWRRFLGRAPDRDASGVTLQAKNVIIEFVLTRRGPYAESGTVADTESITVGAGRAYILRNGRVESGWWHHRWVGNVTAYRFPGGQKDMTLAPGNTWVEVVPVRGYPVSFKR